MIKSFPEKSMPKAAIILMFFLFMIMIILRFHIHAQEKRPETPKKSTTETPIHIVADQLLVDQKANTAEFIGNVTANQGKTKITSHRLIIFYKKNHQNQAIQGETTEDTLEKVVAEGSVEIKFDNGLAVTPHAVYNTNEKVLVLTGKGSQLIRGKDTISGNKIVFNRQSGKLKVEGRVKANIYSDEKVLN